MANSSKNQQFVVSPDQAENSSGIYIVVLRVNGEVYSWKILNH
jgi:hypothetical protein